MLMPMLSYALVRKKPTGNVSDSAANKKRLKSDTKVAENLSENKPNLPSIWLIYNPHILPFSLLINVVTM